MSYYRSARAGDDRPEVAALRELVTAGLVGCSAWEHELWVWREAWPLTGLPLITDWTVEPMPERSAIAEAPRRVPGLVAVLGWAFWRVNEKKDRELKALHEKIVQLAEAQTVAIVKVEAALVALRDAIEDMHER